MKGETVKSIGLGFLGGLCLMFYEQAQTNAGPQPSARVVPTAPQSFIPPSKAVAAAVNLHADDPNGVVQPSIDLEPGEVFMLTAVTARVANSVYASSTGLRVIRRGSPSGPIVAYCKIARDTSTDETVLARELTQTVYPSGIRFERTPNGRADLFLVGRTSVALDPQRPFVPADLPDVMLHGYITTDY